MSVLCSLNYINVHGFWSLKHHNRRFVGAWLELVPFRNKECEDSRLDMNGSVVEPNLVYFLQILA